MRPVGAYELVVNGEPRVVEDALPTESLLYVLRERLGLPGSKNACEQGECGSCSVLVDGVLVCACLELGAGAAGCMVTTVEGLADGGLLTDVQQALLQAGGVQCGFCTPGFVVAIHDLLTREPDPHPLEVREALAGNLCRCTGYGRIVAAIETVVTLRRRADGGSARPDGMPRASKPGGVAAGATGAAGAAAAVGPEVAR